MPRIPVEYAINDFSGGLNNRMDPLLIGKNELQTAINVDLSSGILRGVKGSTTAYTSGTIPASATFLRYIGTTWVASTSLKSSLYDGTNTYVCDGTNTQVYNSGGNYQLGVEVPSVTFNAYDTGGTLPASVYALQFVYEDSSGNTSNPVTKTGEVNAPGGSGSLVASWTWPANERITGMRVYCEVGGIKGLVTTVARPTNTYSVYAVSTLNNADTSNPLTWGAGGRSTIDGLTSDHSVAPALELFSTGLHGVVGELATVNGDIIFGAKDNTLYWNIPGEPFYWPTLNFHDFAEDIEALITYTAQTLVFTRSAVFSVSGTNHENMVPVRTNASVGCRVNTGKCVVNTPYGVVFLSQRGIEVFDGDRSQVVSDAKLSEAYLNGLTPVSAAFLGKTYYLFHTTGILVMEFRGGNVVFSTISFIVTSVTVANVAGVDGIYYTQAGGGAVYQLLGSSTRTSWEAQTGEFAGGSSAFMKRPGRLYFDSTGAIDVSLYRDGTGISIGSLSSNRGAAKMLRLKTGTNASIGQRFSLYLVGNGSTAEMHEVRIVGE